MRALPLALSLALILAGLIVIGLGLRAPAEDAAAPAQEPPRYSVTNAHWLRLNRQGQPEFRAQAASIDYFSDETVQLAELEVDALGGWSSPWHLQAPLGSGRAGERRLLLESRPEQPVLARGATAEGAPLDFRTDRLWIDLLRRELHTESAVTMESPFRRATARGLKADFNGERVQLLNDVQMEYAPAG